jgi:hypothetical protein
MAEPRCGSSRDDDQPGAVAAPASTGRSPIACLLRGTDEPALRSAPNGRNSADQLIRAQRPVPPGPPVGHSYGKRRGLTWSFLLLTLDVLSYNSNSGESYPVHPIGDGVRDSTDFDLSSKPEGGAERLSLIGRSEQPWPSNTNGWKAVLAWTLGSR